jgi:Ca2+-binding EF-hand superfamily protein
MMGRGRGRTHADVAPKGPRCEQHFDAFDADQDGKLTREEFAARPHVHGDADALFAERDLNQDAILTREEFCSAWRR